MSSGFSSRAAERRWSPVHHLSEHAQETPRLQAGRAVQRSAQTTHRHTGTILLRPRWFTLRSRPRVPEIRLCAHRKHPGGLRPAVLSVDSFKDIVKDVNSSCHLRNRRDPSACWRVCVCVSAGPQGGVVLQHQTADQTSGGNSSAVWRAGGTAAVSLQSPSLQRKHRGQKHSQQLSLDHILTSQAALSSCSTTSQRQILFSYSSKFDVFYSFTYQFQTFHPLPVQWKPRSRDGSWFLTIWIIIRLFPVITECQFLLEISTM